MFPGLTISGAISMAINEINKGELKEMKHSVDFKVAETFGEEVSSIRQTAVLWADKVAGYIGPQETCIHEGRMAAAFNLPMISYVIDQPSNLLIYVIDVFQCLLIYNSFVHISRHHGRRISLHSREHARRIHKSRNLWFHFYLLLIGHR